ncbi:hypothetical protein CRG98_006539 [Punica granatum]|uniref:Uncharacterized protein n=1 Tax=Punica granatum TaxID=22663 RepID=A0A2I0KX50_PUNGR|nr:hypothetical protein CRG98_006539 [Punica granatum]
MFNRSISLSRLSIAVIGERLVDGAIIEELLVAYDVADKLNVLEIYVRKAVSKHASKANGIEPEPTKYVPSRVAKLYKPECGLSSGPVCALLDRAAWECPPSLGDA